jgi:leucyl-tRNA synthetase
MMIFLNETSGLAALPRALWAPFVLLLSQYAPHLAEELWAKLGNAPSVSSAPWPEWIEDLTAEELVEVVYQINGKIRAKESLPAGIADAELKEKALGNERIKEILSGREIRKVIVVPNKLVKIVAAL